MSGLSRWLAREARRQTGRSDLLSALVLGQGVAYVRYRLGFLLLRLLVRTGLHAVEVLFLSSVLPFEYLAPLLSYRALTALATTLHWGAIESLRQQVRAAIREHAPDLAWRAVESWLSAGVLVALVPVLFVSGRIVRSGLDAAGEGISLFDAYGLACCLRLLFDVYARTYHAGIFALQRVYRPLPTLLATDLLEVAIIVFGFEAGGAWTIALAIVSAGAVDTGLTVFYARLAYRRRKLRSPRLLPRVHGLGALRLSTLKLALVQSLANAGMQLDAWLLLVLVQVDPPRGNALSFATIYYVLRPLLGLATHWVRSFYFDLSQIDAGVWQCFRPRLLRLLRRVALGSALVGALLTLGFAWSLWPGMSISRWLWLVPFFVVRALFALGQLEAFAAQRYRVLLMVTGLLAAGIALCAWLAPSGVSVLLLATLLLSVSVLGLRVAERGSPRAPTASPVLGLPEFLSDLRQRDAVCLGVGRVARDRARVGKVMLELAAAHSGMRVTRYGRDGVLLFVPADARLPRASLLEASAGTLTQLWLSEACRGVDSIGMARAHASLPTDLQAALTFNPQSHLASEFVVEFRRAYPNGTCFDLVTGQSVVTTSQLPRAWLGDFVRHVVAASRDQRLRTRLPLELAVYAPSGQARLVFLVPRPTPGFAAFRARVHAASLHASWYGEQSQTRLAASAQGVGARLAKLTRL